MKTKIIQHSKKLATTAMVCYFALCFMCVFFISFMYLEEPQLNAIVSIHAAAATLCGVIVTGYMGNSSIEKYTNRKYNYSEALGLCAESENG